MSQKLTSEAILDLEIICLVRGDSFLSCHGDRCTDTQNHSI